MTVETVNLISDLDPTYPAEGEVGTLHEGNNHIRNIKTGIKATFPNIAAPLSATAGVFNKLIGLTATAGDLNVLEGVAVAGLGKTSLAGLAGLTATAGALNILSDVTVTGAQLNAPTAMTAQASTSGTTIDFTSIPAWVKRVTVLFAGVSISAAQNIIVRLGTSSGVVTSGYIGYSAAVTAGATAACANDDGFPIQWSVAAGTQNGSMVLENIDGNTWVSSSSFGNLTGTAGGSAQGGGYIALGAALDRVQITTTAGTATFDAGTINVLYE